MSDLINRLRHADTPYAKPTALEILTDEAADALEAAHARIAELECDLAFQKQVTDAARQHQAELLERAEQAETRIAELEAQIAAAEKQEPVAEVIKWRTSTGHTAWDFKVFDKTLEHSAKLYTRPLPSNAEGWRKDAEVWRNLC